jgi:putative spermidine/putrescine transport system permease protein
LRRGARIWVALVLVFLYAPLLLVIVNAFNSSRTFAFPPTGFTWQWWRAAVHSQGMWHSLANSVVIGLAATGIALILGTMAALAVQRYDFFGKNAVNLLVVLPITLPGIVTGIALNATFTSALGLTLGLATVVIGHATFCIVIVFNNIQARLRRLGTTSRTPPPTWAPRPGRLSGSSPSPCCAGRWWPAPSWRSP